MGKERRKMIFEECDNGLKVEITHRELMGPVLPYLAMLIRAREIYQRNTYADMDDDDTEEE